MANPFLVLGGIAVGLVTATFGILQVPGWVASAQDAAAINDLSNLNQAQAIHRSTGGTFSADITTLSGGVEASPLDLSAPVTTLAMPAAGANDTGTSFHLSNGVTLKHLDINEIGDAYCAVVESASGRFFAGSEGGKISSASKDVDAAMDSAACQPGTRGEKPEVPEVPKVPAATFTLNTTAPGCTAPGLNLGTEAPTGTINWGDGTTTEATAGANAHPYASPGTYKVTVTGTIPTFGQMGLNTAQCVISMDSWSAESGTHSAFQMFLQARNLESVATPPKSVTNMAYMFSTAQVFNQDIGHWDVSNVTDMSFMFNAASAFNQDISGWNVAQVKTMKSMFSGAAKFAQPIGKWQVGNVLTMDNMFGNARAFNQDLSTWDVSKVTDFRMMFSGTSIFNKPLNAWDTKSATTMSNMFYMNKVFSQDLSSWNMGNVTDLSGMFDSATAFNGKLDWKNTAKLGNVQSMFRGATKFNQDLTTWNTSKVTGFKEMFSGATAFNGNVSNWNTSYAGSFDAMFQNARAFSGDLTKWVLDPKWFRTAKDFHTGSALTQSKVPAALWG